MGFRPAVYRLAVAAGLGGWVRNRTEFVELTLEGAPAAIDAFIEALPGRLPPNAEIASLRRTAADTTGGDTPVFRILDSGPTDAADVVIPADLALCEACRREILDPADRRYRYPFTTCTHCGPRYTVVHDLPYDRERTTMAPFTLCAACRREYEDPADRRFHAETVACPACGPRLRLERADGTPVPGDALAEAGRLLDAGRILAVKGIGGFLLAADALNRTALETLRARKRRPDKPFAVMARDLDTLRRYAAVSAGAAALL
ncbi:MAG: carbamoyltransferase HypF, partial [Lentisphaerae bacterium]|nr:carbamoyltransferase HypF [Lentisphaerota bacterium]